MAYKDPQSPKAKAAGRRNSALFRQRHPERVAAVKRACYLKSYVPKGQPPPIDRIMAKVEVVDGCWLFQGAKRSGYGQISVEGKNKQAHRVSYEVNVGPIPEGLELDHLCRATNCVNPDHLEPVTHAENIRRAHAS